MKSNTMLTSIITCKPHLLFRCIKYEKLYNKTVYQFFYDLFILNCAFKRDKEVRALGERVIACNVAVNLINY